MYGELFGVVDLRGGGRSVEQMDDGPSSSRGSHLRVPVHDRYLDDDVGRMQDADQEKEKPTTQPALSNTGLASPRAKLFQFINIIDSIYLARKLY